MVQSALVASQHRIAAPFEGGGVIAGGAPELVCRPILDFMVVMAVGTRAKLSEAFEAGFTVAVAVVAEVGAATVVMAHVDVG